MNLNQWRLVTCVLALLLLVASRRGIGQEETDAPAAETEAAAEIQWKQRGEIVEFGRDVTLKADESCRELVVLGGDVIVDGRVERDAVVLGGKLIIRGKVEGAVVVVAGAVDVQGEIGRELTLVLGDAKFGADARVGEEAVIIGKLTEDQGAVFDEGRFVIGLGENLPGFEWLPEWIMQGAFYARPMPLRLGWAWATAGVITLIYFVVALLFPRPIEASVAQLSARPFGAFFAGLLVLLLFGPLVVLLSISVIGLVVVPFLGAALVVCFFIGKASMLCFVGYQLGTQTGIEVLKKPVIAVLFGAVVFTLLYLIPVIGLVTWGIMSTLGIGAVCLAAASGLRREEAGEEPVPVPVAGGGAVSAEIGPPESTPPPTPREAVPLRRVGFWLRFWALALDVVVIGVPWALLDLNVGPLFWLVWAAYHVVMWTWKGTTIGGIVLGLKCVRSDGRELTFPVALIRALSSVFSALALGLGFFWAGWTRDRQSWHDRIAGTVIVRVPKGVSLV